MRGFSHRSLPRIEELRRIDLGTTSSQPFIAMRECNHLRFISPWPLVHVCDLEHNREPAEREQHFNRFPETHLTLFRELGVVTFQRSRLCPSAVPHNGMLFVRSRTSASRRPPKAETRRILYHCPRLLYHTLVISIALSRRLV